MAGEPELTGLAKHFNSVTFTGRANVAKVIFLVETAILLIIITTISGNLRSHSDLLTVVAVKAKNYMKK